MKRGYVCTLTPLTPWMWNKLVKFEAGVTKTQTYETWGYVFSRVCIRCRVRETAEFLKEILHLSDRDSRLVCMRVIQRTLLKTHRFLFHLLDYSSWSLLHSTTVYEYAHYNVDKVSR